LPAFLTDAFALDFAADFLAAGFAIFFGAAFLTVRAVFLTTVVSMRPLLG